MTERLTQIANLLFPCECVADIGTDHAYLAVHLIKNGLCKRVIASDINVGPLQNAKQTVEDHRLAEAITLRLGAGFKPYKVKEADAYIIAGMGGHLIADILAEGGEIPQKSSQLILQPMQHPEVLRRYLCDHGYKILNEKFIREKEKFYQVISAVYIDECTPYTEFDLKYGLNVIDDKNYRAFLVAKDYQIQQILSHLSLDKHKDKYNTLMNEQMQIKEMLCGD